MCTVCRFIFSLLILRGNYYYVVNVCNTNSHAKVFLKKYCNSRTQIQGITLFIFIKEGRKLFCSGTEVFYSTEQIAPSIDRKSVV